MKNIHKLLLYLLLALFPYLDAQESETLFIPHPKNQSGGRDCNVAITCVFQNEAPWLQEWIEFHRLIGVSHFYLYNHLSTDHYLEILEPYLDEGIVEIFDFMAPSLNGGNQIKIYNHSLKLSKEHSNWLAIIDTDEFIVPIAKDNLNDYLKKFPRYIGGIEINWVCYGTSNVWSLEPGELLIEKLSFRAPVDDGVNRWAKSIVRPSAVRACVSAHGCQYLKTYQHLRVTPAPPNEPPQSDAAVGEIRINHYIWRTKEFFYQVKLPRIKNWDQNHFKGSNPVEYEPITNQIEDTSIFKYTEQLRNILFTGLPLQSEPVLLPGPLN